MWVTLAEAVDITSQEIGFESFSTFDYTAGSGQLSTIGESATLDWTGSGDLTTILSAGDLVVIDYVNYNVVSVTVNTVVIDVAITLALSDWSYVQSANKTAYLADYNKRLRALQTAYRTLLPLSCEPDDLVQQELKDANAFLGAFYFQNLSTLPINNSITNVTSKRIGDLSYSYDLSKSVDPIPSFIISILGDCYIGGVRPAFFDK